MNLAPRLEFHSCALVPSSHSQGLNQQLLTEQVQGGAWSFTRKLFFRPATLHRCLIQPVRDFHPPDIPCFDYFFDPLYAPLCGRWAVLSLCPRVRLPDRDVRGLVDDLHATLDRAGTHMPHFSQSSSS